MGQVTNEEFLSRLTALFESSKDKHSIYVSHKRITRGSPPAESISPGENAYPIVVRATDGAGKGTSQRCKLTTHVEPSQLSRFQDAYSAILRTSLTTFLKKRDKAKERRIDKMVKDQRRKMEETEATRPKVSSVGSKRGAGRRKRQQAERKAAKLRKERQRVRLQAKTNASTLRST